MREPEDMRIKFIGRAALITVLPIPLPRNTQSRQTVRELSNTKVPSGKTIRRPAGQRALTSLTGQVSGNAAYRACAVATFYVICGLVRLLIPAARLSQIA